MDAADISIVVNEDTSPVEVSDLALELTALGISSEVNQQHHGRHWAALEWLIPTAIIVMFGKPYLETLAKKMAEDHYAVAKGLGKKLWEKCFGPKKSVTLILQAKDGSAKESTFCMGISFRAKTPEGIDVTLLFREGASEGDIESAIGAFLFMLGDTSKPSLLATAVAHLPETIQGHRQLVYFNPATKELQIIDWITSSRLGELTSSPIPKNE